MLKWLKLKSKESKDVSIESTSMSSVSHSSETESPPQVNHQSEIRSNISSSENSPSTSSASSFTIIHPDIPLSPYQPDTVNIPVQLLNGKTLRFQKTWFERFPWLHFDARIGRVLCHVCALAQKNKHLNLATKTDKAFLSKGFCNWKKAVEKFQNHAKSSTHKLAVSNELHIAKSKSVLDQVNVQHTDSQKDAQKALLKIISSIKYLAAQGLALQGNSCKEGNFMEMLRVRANDVKELQDWLKKKHTYTSSTIQNDILRIISHMCLENNWIG